MLPLVVATFCLLPGWQMSDCFLRTYKTPGGEAGMESSTASSQRTLVGASASMVTVQSRIRAVAKVQRTTLILGPTGSGKDVVARSLHDCSTRRERPFVAVHCGALPENL